MNVQIEKRVKKAVNLAGFSKQMDRYVSLHATLNNLLDRMTNVLDQVNKILQIESFGDDWAEFPNLQNLLVGKFVVEIEAVLDNVRITR